jgi:hypothetical protein
MLNSFIRSTTIHSEASLWIHHKDGGRGGEACSSWEEACAKFWLRWQHPPSVGLYSDIKSWATLDGCDSYSQGALFGSPCTLTLVIDEGVSCLSFRLEDEKKLVPYGYIGELLGYKKEARSKLMFGRTFGNDFERKLQGTQNFYLSGFLWGSSTWSKENKLVEMRGEGASWRSSFQHVTEFICWKKTKIG